MKKLANMQLIRLHYATARHDRQFRRLSRAGRLAHRKDRRRGCCRAVFRKACSSTKRSYWPVNMSVTAKVRTTTLGPFGEVIRSTGPMAKANPIRFSTKYDDDESDLLYYGYRYYKPSTGGWLSRDPADEEGGENLYGFVANSPINDADGLGLTLVDTFKNVGYHFWRNSFVTTPQWRQVMDAWFYETGPNPAYYLGNFDPRNIDIMNNTGFQHLLNCWVAKRRGEQVPQSSEWDVRDDGFWWHYGYWGFLGLNTSAGGRPLIPRRRTCWVVMIRHSNLWEPLATIRTLLLLMFIIGRIGFPAQGQRAYPLSDG